MASLSCTTKSVKLASGESFILPPGAKLIGATNASLLTAKDDCISTENLEELQCYVCLVPIGAKETNLFNGSEQYWESHDSIKTGSPRLTGYVLNGTYTAFSTGPFIAFDPGYFQGTTLVDEIKAISGVIDFIYNTGTFDMQEGQLNMFIIQTIPSVANNLELVVNVDVPSIVDPGSNGYFKFIKYSDAVTAGYSLPTVPFCSPE